jgi:tetratricopeptide (TPR) repeat protein
VQASLFFLLAALAPAQQPRLGEATFVNSGAPAAQADFLEGLLLLHSFEYDDAHEAFQRARAVDPDFAMAAWGEALTHQHPLWLELDLPSARAALESLAPTFEGRLAKAPTGREKHYLRAADALFFSSDDTDAREDAYAAEMARLHAAYPDDQDAAALYALALLTTAHEGRDFRIYMRAAAVVEGVFAKNPRHPGAAHYLIHCYDDPVHAPLGLRAAELYADLAPEASHALHMPAHIFLALGDWDRVVASNEASWAASEARVARKQLGPELRDYHSLWWLNYGYLQQGRLEKARETIAIAVEEAKRPGAAMMIRDHASVMRDEYLAETRDWDGAIAKLEIDVTGLPVQSTVRHFMRGWAALDRDDPAAAGSELDAIREIARQGGTVPVIVGRQLLGLIRIHKGETQAGLEMLESAAETEQAMPFGYGPPAVVKPSWELLGDALLELSRHEEARKAYQRSLERNPGRRLSLLGLARAAGAE